VRGVESSLPIASRRRFLVAAGGAAAAFLSGYGFGNAASSQVTFGPLIETILPFSEDPFRAIGVAAIEARIESLFHLAAQPPFRASLAAFMDVATFPAINPVIALVERQWYPGADIEAQIAEDARSFAQFRDRYAIADFAALNSDARAAYMNLWQRSAFGGRRRFYQATRTVILAAVYSIDSVWQAIGYAGPVLKR
jgi:hypothetical protein